MGIFQQFPYSNFHEFNLDQIIRIMREMQDEWAATKAEWASYKEFIDNYFENLDVSQEVLNALKVMAADGSLNAIIDPVIVNETAEWLEEHVTVPETVVIDDSLSIPGACADAKATGDAIDNMITDLNAAIGLDINDQTLYTSDDTPHQFAQKRQFYSVLTPGNTWIHTVKVPLVGVGGGAVLNAEIWEVQDDNATLQKVKLVSHTPVANSVNEIPINYFARKKAYVAIYFYNVQIYNIDGTGTILYDNINNQDTTTLAISSLSSLNNKKFTGGFDYSIVTSDFDAPYQLPVKWRQGIINNTGNLYASEYGIITDFIIPTALCDYITPVDTSFNIHIVYYTSEHGKPIFASRSADLNTTTPINKTYPFFMVHVFKNWSTQIPVNTGNNIVKLYTSVKPIPDSFFEKIFSQKSILNINDIWSICHQGYADNEIGHNKRGGYAAAAARGFTHGETDVKLTADNKVVCCHDDTFVDATSGVTVTIANETLADLQTHDYYGTVIATLGEIIEECKRYGLKLFIDQLSTDNVDYVCAAVSEYNAWDICVLLCGYHNDYPDIAATLVNEIRTSYNSNATVAILCNDMSAYTGALNYALTLENAVLDIGQYNNSHLATLKTIAAAINGKCKLVIWTVDDYNPALLNAIPYINGFTSNRWSGNDVFNPTIANGKGFN